MQNHFPRATLALLLSVPASVALADDGIDVSGDVRFGYTNLERDDRSNVSSDSDDWRARIRLGAILSRGDWDYAGRIVGRYNSEVSANSPYLKFHAPTRSGAAFGDTTIDTLYARHNGDGWSVTLGRFQSSFALPGVASKSLDRLDSPSFDVHWTDGVHLASDLTKEWRGHMVLQYHHDRGLGKLNRAPLDFSKDSARAGVYVGVHGKPSGRLVTRSVGMTWYPSALADEGLGQRSREDYLALDAKVAARWPLGESGTSVLVAGELGYAPNRPQGTVMNTGQSGDVGGLAWQTSVNLENFLPQQSIGVVYGRVDAGWLLSPDLRENDELSEIRYKASFLSRWTFEARYRLREELKVPDTAQQARFDKDFYLRLTAKF